MKLSKILFVGLIVVFIFSLSACVYAPASYVCDSSNVESVQIIELGKWDEETREYHYTVLVDVIDHFVFIERLNNLKDNDFFFVLGTPDTFLEGDIMIKVNYLNGDYDLIKRTKQVYYRAGATEGGSRVTFDKEQFNALIDDYLPKTASTPVP